MGLKGPYMEQRLNSSLLYPFFSTISPASEAFIVEHMHKLVVILARGNKPGCGTSILFLWCLMNSWLRYARDCMACCNAGDFKF